MASLIRRVPPNCCQASRRRRRPRHPRRFSRPSAIRRTYRTPSSMMTSLIKRAICPIGRLRPQSSTCALAHSGCTQATRRRGKAGSSSISRCHSRAASDGRRAAGTVGAVLGTDVATACWRRSGHRRGRRWPVGAVMGTDVAAGWPVAVHSHATVHALWSAVSATHCIISLYGAVVGPDTSSV